MPRRLGFETVQYHQRVLALDPIAYWIQDEKVGTVSYDWVRRRQGSDQDGAYTGVTLGRPGIGDGRTSPYFDGVNDFNNVFTVPFQGRFNGAEGTCMVWARVADSGVWTAGAARYIFELQVNANNRVALAGTTGAANTLQWAYVAGGVVIAPIVTPLSSVDWTHYAITWSATADEVIFYINGVREGPIQNGLGVWAGILSATRSLVGATNSAPIQNPWHGYIAHPAVFDRALTPQELS